MSIPIKTIEDAIVAALAASDLASVCKTIDSYHGEIGDIVEELKTLSIPLPAALVCYTGSGFNERTERSFDDKPIFAVISIAKDLRGRGNLRTGIYEMIEMEKDLLINNALGLESYIDPLRPVNIEALAITKVFSIYGFKVQTFFTR